MTASLDLRRALEKYLVATPNVPEIAWENQAYTPIAHMPWLQARLISTATTGALGIGAPVLWEGTLRVTLYYPDKQGAGAADAFADALMTRFQPGTIITDNTTRVLCGETDRGRATNEGAWFVIPLDINWRSYAGE